MVRQEDGYPKTSRIPSGPVCAEHKRVCRLVGYRILRDRVGLGRDMPRYDRNRWVVEDSADIANLSALMLMLHRKAARH